MAEWDDQRAWDHYTYGDEFMSSWQFNWLKHDYNNDCGLWDPEPWYTISWTEFSEPWGQYASDHADYDYGDYLVLYP